MSYNLISSFKLFSLIFFFFFFSGTFYSQENSYLDSLSGKFALQFQVADNFQLSSFQGATLSGKYNINRFSAVRIGFSVNLINGNNNQFQQYLDTAVYNGSDGGDHVTGFNLNTQYLYYIETLNEIFFYCGTGPNFGYTFAKQNNHMTTQDTSFDANQTTKTLEIGLDILAGAEWMFSKRMSLSAEYGLSFYYIKTRYYRNDPARFAQANEKSFNIRPANIKFGLSVYF